MNFVYFIIKINDNNLSNDRYFYIEVIKYIIINDLPLKIK